MKSGYGFYNAFPKMVTKFRERMTFLTRFGRMPSPVLMSKLANRPCVDGSSMFGILIDEFSVSENFV
jgi:hypothetical protein